MVKVSIIVPCYNTSKYLKSCLDSLINQTLKDIEIILINDGSTDNSNEIITSYNDKRIKYVNKENEGIGKSRNKGIELAKGEYLSFIDSDDYVTLDFCEKMYNKAKKDNCDIVICDYFKDNESMICQVTFPSFKPSSLKENPDIINNVNLGPCNKIYKRELFKNKKNRFVEDLKYEDAPLVCSLLIDANKIGKIDECLTYYVIHNNSETTKRDERIFDILKIVDLIVNEMKTRDYLYNQMINLAVMILTDYNVQQRYIKNSNLRRKFINESFNYLNKLDSNWKKSSYLKKFSFFKRLIITNSSLIKLYCFFYVLLHN